MQNINSLWSRVFFLNKFYILWVLIILCLKSKITCILFFFSIDQTEIIFPPPKVKRGRPKNTRTVIGLPKKRAKSEKAYCKKLPREKDQS